MMSTSVIPNFTVFLFGFHPKQVLGNPMVSMKRGWLIFRKYTFNTSLFFQGVLMVQDHYRAIMQFSIPKDINAFEKAPLHKTADWFCIKVSCFIVNYSEKYWFYLQFYSVWSSEFQKEGQLLQVSRFKNRV